MKEVYPVFIAENNGVFLVYVPDWDIYTEGKDVLNAMEMSRDAIGLKGIDFQDDGKELPKASNYGDALQKAKKDVGIFNYSKGMLTMVDVDFTEYRKKQDWRKDRRMVKKNCTIPYYLNVEAEKLGINFSRVLQEALVKIINK